MWGTVPCMLRIFLDTSCVYYCTIISVSMVTRDVGVVNVHVHRRLYRGGGGGGSMGIYVYL